MRGCDPKKVLVGASEALDWVRRMEGKGIRAPGAAIDWPELMRFKRTFIEGVGEGNEKWLSEAGVEVLHGDARFTAPTVVRVDGRELESRLGFFHPRFSTSIPPGKILLDSPLQGSV